MSPKRSRKQDRSIGAETTEYFRRHVLAVGAGTGVMMLAGCAAETTGDDPDGDGSSMDDAESGASTAGTFRLLISDQPVAIDDFDELNVSFDRARIFSEDAEEDDESEDQENDTGEDDEDDETEDEENESEEDDGEEGSEDDGGTETEGDNGGTETEEDDGEEESEDGGTDDSDQRGFEVIELDGATVDLTQVVGDKAISVFDGELEEGRYTKVELYATDVEGIVEGESVGVTIPSGKLQIVKPFEVVAGESLSFVFDINVVKKGTQQEYNLLPVISESGVAGKDVEVEEVDTGASDATEESNGTNTADEDENEE